MPICLDPTIKQKVRIRNICLPDEYKDWVDFIAYIQDGIEAGFADTTASVTKVNSTLEEETVVTTKITMKFTTTAKMGTYFSTYMRLLTNLKKFGNQQVMNSFQLEVENAMDITLYPLCYMNLAHIVYENIDGNEYKVEFTMTANGVGIVREKPGFTAITENPYTVDANLVVTPTNSKTFELEYETTATSVSFEQMIVEVTDKASNLVIANDYIEDGTLGMHTMILTNDLPDGDYTFVIKAQEQGYANNYIAIGTADVTLPIVRSGKNGKDNVKPTNNQSI